MDRRRFLAGTGCGVAALCSGCVTGTPLSPDVTETKTRTYDVAEETALRVQNQHGSVTVEGYDGDEVELEVEKSARTQEALDAASVTATESDRAFQLQTEYDVSDDEQRATVSLTINCPETVRVAEATTTHGSVDVTGVTGDATVESENGSLTVEDVDGTVSLSTTNGSVDVDGPEFSSAEDEGTHFSGTLGDGTRALSFETTNGDVDLTVLSN